MSANENDVQSIFRFFNEVGVVAQLANNLFERALPNGLSLAQFTVLNYLTRRGGNKTPLQLSRAMRVTKGAMTNTLGHLERGGLIVIVPDESDGRSKRIDITAEGEASRQRALEAIGPELNYLWDRLPVGSVKATLPVLENLHVSLNTRLR